jgi:hypothetical protein
MFPPTLLTLPNDLLSQILTECDINDIFPFSASCRKTHELLHATLTSVWRECFLAHFDDPRDSIVHRGRLAIRDQDWEERFKRRVQANKSPLTYPEELIRALEEIPPMDVQHHYPSANIKWVTRLIFSHDQPSPSNHELRPNLISQNDIQGRPEAISYLLSLPGSIGPARLLPQDLLSRSMRLRAYNPAEVTKGTLLGPFAASGSQSLTFYAGQPCQYSPSLVSTLTLCSGNSGGPRIRWQQLEAITYTLRHTLECLSRHNENSHWLPFVDPPMELETIRAFSAPDYENHLTDWAGVAGNWVRITATLDYM